MSSERHSWPLVSPSDVPCGDGGLRDGKGTHSALNTRRVLPGAAGLGAGQGWGGREALGRDTGV